MRIAMLGPLEIRTDAGEPREVTGARLRRLVIVLALHPGQIVPASLIVDAVWGDEPPAEPANAVQALVSRLRRAVPGIDVVNRGTGYRLSVDDDSVDVHRFECLVTEGRAKLLADPAKAAEILREALALWRGPALVDAAGSEATVAPVARLDELRLVALHDRIDAELRAGATGPAVAELEGLVAAYPLREQFTVLLMRALSGSGERGRALHAYEQARVRLDEQLGVRPSAALAAEHVRILRADGDAGTPEPAPVPDARAGPTNLRAELTSFVGREQDIAAVEALLDTSRLTTLVGPGGSGKTRLAGYAARKRLPTQGDGAWMVEFAAVSDPAEVAPAVLAAIGVRDRALMRTAGTPTTTEAATDPTERLVTALSTKSALLVFDNCEHLIAEVATLAHTLLGACPSVRILATSREPLGVTGEALWMVEPLALPPEGTPADRLGTYAAARLLEQRAAAVRPGFAITGANADAVVRICHALDGMPLAIELAAARLRTMSPHQLAERLDNRFDLLTGGSRTALPRHQTLRAVVDWSWDLLDDAERALWRRMSVFAGGATLTAAERVCAGGPLAAARVLDVATALVDKSLLVVRDDGPQPRYLMLETIRAYGAERLDEAGERAATAGTYVAYFVGLAEQARDGLLGPEQLGWLARLTADHDNLHAAVRTAVAAGDGTAAQRLASALGWYWWLRGHRTEGVELVSAALGVDMPDTDDQVRLEARAGSLTVGALLAADGTHEFGLALAWFDEAAATVRRIGTPSVPLLRMVWPLRAAFAAFMPDGVYDPSAVVELPVDDPHPWIAATSRLMRAHVLLNFGRAHDQADRDFTTALRTYRACGERWGTAFALMSLATLRGWRGEFAASLPMLDEAMRCVVELDAWEDRVNMRVLLVRMAWLAGDKQRAHAELATVRREAQRVGLPEALGHAALLAGDMARLDGDLDTAAAELDRATDFTAHHTVAPQFKAVVASANGLLAAARGDLDAARAYHGRALATGMASRDAPIMAQVLVGGADLALHEGAPDRAAFLLGVAESVRGIPDRSLPDEHRVAAAATAALGAGPFEAAYRRGRSADRRTAGEIAGVPLPETSGDPRLATLDTGTAALDTGTAALDTGTAAPDIGAAAPDAGTAAPGGTAVPGG